jgi:hypothetical protein
LLVAADAFVGGLNREIMFRPQIYANNGVKQNDDIILSQLNSIHDLDKLIEDEFDLDWDFKKESTLFIDNENSRTK